jgi:signal transduction histidine kinase
VLVDDIVSRWADRLATGRITCRVDADVPTINADRRWLGFALDELIGNAVEFSSDGGPITVTAAGTTGSRGVRGVEITVEDRGAGMPVDDLERLFEVFVQGDMSHTRLHGGLGLGLALVRRVVEGHGGHVTVESCNGAGSKFSLRLPSPLVDAGS